MLARITRRKSGLSDYLKSGKREDSIYTRNEKDNVISQFGNLDTFSATELYLKRNKNYKDNYIHITISYSKEDMEKMNMMNSGEKQQIKREIIETYIKHHTCGYDIKNEVIAYAETHEPIIKYENDKERLEHEHIAIALYNPISDTKLRTTFANNSFIDDVFQTYINKKYSLSIPRVNERENRDGIEADTQIAKDRKYYIKELENISSNDELISYFNKNEIQYKEVKTKSNNYYKIVNDKGKDINLRGKGFEHIQKLTIDKEYIYPENRSLQELESILNSYYEKRNEMINERRSENTKEILRELNNGEKKINLETKIKEYENKKIVINRTISLNQSKLKEVQQSVKSLSSEQIISLAIESVSDKKTRFTMKDIVKKASGIDFSNRTQRELEKAFLNYIDKNNNIVKTDNDKFATKEMIEAENTVHSVLQDKTLKLETSVDKIDSFILQKYNNMTDEQKAMTKAVLNTSSQFLAIQGDAGTGKTYAMKAINEYIKENKEHVEVVGLSFTGKAAAGLEADSNIKSSTIHKFLNAEKKKNHSNMMNRIIIIDEAGLTGTMQMSEIIKIAKKNNDKVIFVGDTKQFKSIAAGNIFYDMQKNNIETINMSKTMRQKTDVARELVSLTKRKDFKKLFEFVSSEKILEELSKKEIVSEVAKSYIKKEKLIIASKNIDRIEINKEVRKKLNFKESQKIEIYENKRLKETEKIFAENYINNYISTFALENGKELRVVGQKDAHTIIVLNSDNKEVEINLLTESNKMQVFVKKEIDIAVKEKIVITKNSENFKNGEILEVASIKDNIIKFKDNRELDVSRNKHLDYGYCITDYKAQGVTADDVIVVADSKIANINSFYTQVTRAKNSVKIYTDSIKNLKYNISKTQEIDKSKQLVNEL